MEYEWLKPRSKTIVHSILILAMIYFLVAIVSYYQLSFGNQDSTVILLVNFVIVPLVIIYTLVCVIENQRSKN